MKFAAPIIVVASYTLYRVSTFLFPAAKLIAPPYFVIAMVVGVLVVTTLIAFVAKISKIEERSFAKAFYVTTGITASYAVANLAYLFVANLHRSFTALVAALASVSVWYVVKKVYGISNKQVFRFIFYTLLVLAGISFSIGLISSFFIGQIASQTGV